MRHLAACVLVLAAFTASVAVQGRKTFDIYSIDVEGGGATLYVSPSGASALIDTGYQSNGRDADRIVAAAKDAGLTQIDYLITSHYHGDHMGGLAELASRFPIKHLVDHGPNSTPQSSGTAFIQGYMELAGKLRSHVREARRQAPDCRTRLARGGVRRTAALETAAGRRQAEPGMRGFPEAGRDQLRRFPFGREHHLVRKVPDRPPWRI